MAVYFPDSYYIHIMLQTLVVRLAGYMYIRLLIGWRVFSAKLNNRKGRCNGSGSRSIAVDHCININPHQTLQPLFSISLDIQCNGYQTSTHLSRSRQFLTKINVMLINVKKRHVALHYEICDGTNILQCLCQSDGNQFYFIHRNVEVELVDIQELWFWN